MFKYAVLDFETEAIEGRPNYPPKPVGFALLFPDRPPSYFAWGHPTGNNTGFKYAKRALLDVWRSGIPIVCHNAKFDLDVAEVHMGMKPLDWHRIHDTMLLLFLNNPHSDTFALKPAAEKLLGLPPTERDAVQDWLIEHGLARANEKGWGAHIAQAPGQLVGAYAIADIQMTAGLMEKLYPADPRLLEAYNRERRLLPILLRNEREGLAINMRKLERDVATYNLAMEQADDWLCRALRAPGLNIDSDRDLAEALDVRKLVREWRFTPSGQRSVAKDALRLEDFSDPEVYRVLNYRNKLKTALSVFMEPWLTMAHANKGRIHTNWNQVRGFGGGARTGRLSSSPNFQNLPKSFDRRGYQHPEQIELPPLPLVRGYVLADKGQMIIQRDYSQQELRILGHFEDGALQEAYVKHPRMNVHHYVRQQIRDLRGIDLDHDRVKTLNFGLLYGMGMAKLAEALGCSIPEARQIKEAQRAALPGLGILEEELKAMGRAGEAIRTWGGRAYLVEPPKMIDGQMRTFEYKLLNYLIQGSAADCTKQAIINYDEDREYGRMMVNVHDEILVSVPAEHLESEMKILRDSMEQVEFDVPMLSEGKTGASWATLSKYPEA